MMDIPVDAKVYCADGICGRSTYVVINPTMRQVTHLVVRENRFPHNEWLVPVEWVVETSHNVIHLRCDAKELAGAESFIETEFIEGKTPYFDLGYAADKYMMFPYVTPSMPLPIPLEHQNVPPGELAVRRGARVEARDGRVGRVDEFLVNPSNGHITHLVLREGHLWGQKDVAIPISDIDHIEESIVYLKLDKRGIANLPHIPIHR
jgi:sporulation protein YlmC with PRC-barrel domain